MTRFLFQFLFLSTAIVLEAALQSLGLLLPLTAFAVFYFSYTYRGLSSVVMAFLAGMVLDCVFGYSNPFSGFLMIAVTVIALFLYTLTNKASMLSNMLIGALLPLLVSLPPIIIRANWWVALNLLPHFFLETISSAILLPAAVFTLDKCSHFLGLPEFWRQRISQEGGYDAKSKS